MSSDESIESYKSGNIKKATSAVTPKRKRTELELSPEPTKKRKYTKRKQPGNGSKRLPSVNDTMTFIKRTCKDPSTVYFVIPSLADDLQNK